MKTPTIIKKILSFWPILGLLFFLIWGIVYILPMLPDDFISLEKVKNIFKKEEEWVHPDEKYQFFYSQEKLKPKTLDELRAIVVVETPNLGVSMTTTVSTVQELQNAIKNAKLNDTIELTPGTYKTNLIIDKNLTIAGHVETPNLGVSTTTTIIGGNKRTAIYAKDCNLNLSNLTIANSNSAIKTSNASGEISGVIIKNNKKSGIEIRNSNFTIKENIITENGSYGIFADSESEVVVEGNYIEDNKGFQVRLEGEGDIYR